MPEIIKAVETGNPIFQDDVDIKKLNYRGSDTLMQIPEKSQTWQSGI